MAGIDLGDAWADGVWEEGVWADGVWEDGGGAPEPDPEAPVASYNSMRMTVFRGIAMEAKILPVEED